MSAVREGARRSRDDTSGSEAETPATARYTRTAAPATSAAIPAITIARLIGDAATGVGARRARSPCGSGSGARSHHDDRHVVALAGAAAEPPDIGQQPGD